MRETELSLPGTDHTVRIRRVHHWTDKEGKPHFGYRMACHSCRWSSMSYEGRKKAESRAYDHLRTTMVGLR